MARSTPSYAPSPAPGRTKKASTTTAKKGSTSSGKTATKTSTASAARIPPASAPKAAPKPSSRTTAAGSEQVAPSPVKRGSVSSLQKKNSSSNISVGTTGGITNGTNSNSNSGGRTHRPSAAPSQGQSRLHVPTLSRQGSGLPLSPLPGSYISSGNSVGQNLNGNNSGRHHAQYPTSSQVPHVLAKRSSSSLSMSSESYTHGSVANTASNSRTGFYSSAENYSQHHNNHGQAGNMRSSTSHSNFDDSAPTSRRASLMSVQSSGSNGNTGAHSQGVTSRKGAHSAAKQYPPTLSNSSSSTNLLPPTEDRPASRALKTKKKTSSTSGTAASTTASSPQVKKTSSLPPNNQKRQPTSGLESKSGMPSRSPKTTALNSEASSRVSSGSSSSSARAIKNIAQQQIERSSSKTEMLMSSTPTSRRTSEQISNGINVTRTRSCPSPSPGMNQIQMLRRQSSGSSLVPNHSPQSSQQPPAPLSRQTSGSSMARATLEQQRQLKMKQSSKSNIVEPPMNNDYELHKQMLLQQQMEIRESQRILEEKQLELERKAQELDDLRKVQEEQKRKLMEEQQAHEAADAAKELLYQKELERRELKLKQEEQQRALNAASKKKSSSVESQTRTSMGDSEGNRVKISSVARKIRHVLDEGTLSESSAKKKISDTGTFKTLKNIPEDVLAASGLLNSLGELENTELDAQTMEIMLRLLACQQKLHKSKKSTDNLEHKEGGEEHDQEANINLKKKSSKQVGPVSALDIFAPQDGTEGESFDMKSIENVKQPTGVIQISEDNEEAILVEEFDTNDEPARLKQAKQSKPTAKKASSTSSSGTPVKKKSTKAGTSTVSQSGEVDSTSSSPATKEKPYMDKKEILLFKKYEAVLSSRSSSENSLKTNSRLLRQMILNCGLPLNAFSDSPIVDGRPLLNLVDVLEEVDKQELQSCLERHNKSSGNVVSISSSPIPLGQHPSSSSPSVTSSPPTQSKKVSSILHPIVKGGGKVGTPQDQQQLINKEQFKFNLDSLFNDDEFASEGPGSENQQSDATSATKYDNETVDDFKEVLNTSNFSFVGVKGECSLRGKVWKALLGVYRVSATEYSHIVKKGPCNVYAKIKNDTFRTLTTNKKFKARVNDAMLTRILNAFVWKTEKSASMRLLKDSNGLSSSSTTAPSTSQFNYTYVQGMNVLAAPFIYVMPEVDAFYAFASFIQHCCPLYVQPTLEGVHSGLRLLDMCLEVCDPELFTYLTKEKKLPASIYAFPSVMTFSCCTPPLNEVLHLWDFLLAFGVHMNILCIVAQLIIMRTQLLNSTSPMKLLRVFPPLNARKTILLTMELTAKLPDALYEMLVRHPFDRKVFIRAATTTGNPSAIGTTATAAATSTPVMKSVKPVDSKSAVSPTKTRSTTSASAPKIARRESSSRLATASTSKTKTTRASK